MREEAEYKALTKAVRENPDDETPRLALADWVQERGDEAEAQAIREHRSMTLDLMPALRRAFAGCAAGFAMLEASLRQMATALAGTYALLQPTLAELAEAAAEDARPDHTGRHEPAEVQPGVSAEGGRT